MSSPTATLVLDGPPLERRPMTEHSQELTGLLRAHRDGDAAAFERLVEIVYPHLKRIAGRQLARARPGQTLDTTALVNEAYLKLVDHTQRHWQDRSHFFAVTARAMRQILIDYARRKSRQKRGGGEDALPLDEDRVAIAQEAEQLLQLNDALEQLGASHPKLLQVFECRYFAGLSVEETAEALDTSTRTVERSWQQAKAQLKELLTTR